MKAVAVLVVGAGAMLTTGPAVAVAATAHPSGAVLTGACISPQVHLSKEERRLVGRLPRNSNPAALQHRSFGEQMIEHGGFGRFGQRLLRRLCPTSNRHAAQKLLRREGQLLWRRAVDRVQHPEHAQGTLPASDDRPLYWTRLQVTAALRQWQPSFHLARGERDKLITTFEQASRGMDDLHFPPGKPTKRVLVSGFDPYTLDGGSHGTAEGATGNNIRHGNPSGALALALDGATYRTGHGTREHLETYMLPVNYTQFRQGYLEDTVGRWMRSGPRQLDASITMSQAGPTEFDLEQFNGRYHGVAPGNDGSQPCRLLAGKPQLAVNNHGCDSRIVHRWGGPTVFHVSNPPQWTRTSLPISAMIRAHTGRPVSRPPGDTWSDHSVAFGTIWHTNYTEFPDCRSPKRVTRNSPPAKTYPPPQPPTPPDQGSCSYQGGGGNYLSNESAYRNTLLRDRLGVDVAAGHIHTPNMQHFDRGDDYRASDQTFAAWRQAIVAQGKKLVYVAGNRS